MKAIVTKYHGPSHKRGSRIVAEDGDGNRIAVAYNYNAAFSEDVHSQAALALCRKMGWEGELIGGSTKTGHVFVFTSGTRFYAVRDDSRQTG